MRSKSCRTGLSFENVSMKSAPVWMREANHRSSGISASTTPMIQPRRRTSNPASRSPQRAKRASASGGLRVEPARVSSAGKKPTTINAAKPTPMLASSANWRIAGNGLISSAINPNVVVAADSSRPGLARSITHDRRAVGVTSVVSCCA